jgi:hypothetical protein
MAITSTGGAWREIEHASISDDLAFEALLLVQLVCGTSAATLHLPPFLDTFLPIVSLHSLS